MPFYPELKIKEEGTIETKLKKQRVVAKIKALREAMNNHFKISQSNPTQYNTVKIATWNIREFGKNNYKGRSYEELYYIAEIISRFDLIALQEIRADMKEFKKMVKILGPLWSYIATDVTDGGPGNQERMVFLYNSEKVHFRNIAGELTLKEGSKIRASFGERVKLENGLSVKLPGNINLSGVYDAYTAKKGNKIKLKEDLEIPLPTNSVLQVPNNSFMVVKKGTEINRPESGKAEVNIPNPVVKGKDFGLKFPEMSFDDSLRQFARTPFLIAFQAGWLKLNLCTVHIYFGSNDIDKKLEQRIKEIELLTKALADKAKSENEFETDSFLGVLGDFNIISKDHKTMDALEKNGFKVPEELKTIPGTNVKQDKAYDQIAFWNPMRKSRYAKLDIVGANVFDFFDHVYTKEDEQAYRTEGPDVNGLKISTSYATWRTYKMSDHLPMWIELRTDFADEYLKHIEKENETE